jgi:hypothetical protein
MAYRTPAEQAEKNRYEDDALHDDTCWFLAQARKEKAGPRLVTLCRELAMRQETLLANTDKCIAVFQWGGEYKNTDPGDHAPIEDSLCTFNAAQNTVETVFSKVIKSRIAPMPLTTGGGYLQRHRAKQMGKAIEGVLDDNDADAIEEDVVMDALVTDHGAGAVKVIECHDQVKLEHVPIEDVWFDEAEIRHRSPRCCYHVPREGMDKYVAIEQYAGEEDPPGAVGTREQRRQAILKAAATPASWRSKSMLHPKHRVDIFEAWHLPSGPPEEYEDKDGEKKYRHDGRHVVAVEGEDGTLIDEPWDGEGGFPILMYAPRKRRRSIWGLSLMRDLVAPQREYEKLTMKIQNQHQKMGTSGFAASKQSEVNARELKTGTFAAGFLLEFEGAQPPIPLTPEPVAPGTYQYADSIPRNMSERKGVSTLSTASQVPAGLSQASGKALQVFEDVEDVRLLPYHRERERFKIALSWLIVCTAKRIVDRGVKYKARYRGKKGIESIDWKEVLMDKDDFVLKVFPVSQLSKQPAARFAQLTELLNAQAITVEQFKRLYELPDLESETELDTADTDVIDRAMDIMVTTGRYLSPEPFDNLELILQRAGKFYNVCRQQEVPDYRLKLLRDYMEDTEGLIAEKKARAAAAMAPPPGAGMPPPMPGAPPPGPGGMMPPEGPLPGMPMPEVPLPVAA